MHILIAGAGQLGSRYLQGLSKCKEAHTISLVDPSLVSLTKATDRFQAFGGKPNTVKSYLEIPKVLPEVDLAIISTLAPVRKDLVKTILHKTTVKNWILEKLLAQSSQEINSLENLLQANPRVWVNTPRRIMAWYNRIKSHLLLEKSRNNPLEIIVRGGNWGLACNAIHFIDLAEWLTEASVNNAEIITPLSWHPAKRAGFEEARGTIKLTLGKNHILQLTSNNTSDNLKISIKKGSIHLTIEEFLGYAFECNKDINIQGKIVYQSDLIAPLVDTLFSTSYCALPTLETSARQHRILLDTLAQDKLNIPYKPLHYESLAIT